MRPLSKRESTIGSLLGFVDVDYATLQITKTGLEKGYTDATVPFRDFLKRTGIHDYSLQPAGEPSIKYVDVFGLTDAGVKLLKLSFQRPRTKGGRMFRLSMLGGLKRPLQIRDGDVLLFSVRDNQLALANLTHLAERTTPSEFPLTPEKPQGALILRIAKDRLIHVMESTPVCEPTSGTGARATEIADLSGMSLERQRGAIVNALLDELCLEARIESLGNNPKKYRLCPSP